MEKVIGYHSGREVQILKVTDGQALIRRDDGTTTVVKVSTIRGVGRVAC